MKVDGVHYRAIWPAEDGRSVRIIDQTRLPHEFMTVDLTSVEAAAEAISTMRVRGAPLIGVTAAYGMALAAASDPSDGNLERAFGLLIQTRPTAVNLQWALGEMMDALRNRPHGERAAAAYARAALMADEDVATCEAIGGHGLEIIRAAHGRNPDRPVKILTHCNAGWIATVDWGTALAPIYRAHDDGIPVHVWVDETRPRNQGAALTAWELGSHGVPHTIIADNAGGHLMQIGEVDLCLVGTDRTTANGDVANKIGTYLKAVAAFDQGIPFYVALPHATIDWSLERGADIPIELRSEEELTHMIGRADTGEMVRVRTAAPGSHAENYAFDVTPARLVTALITERGVTDASREGLFRLYPERAGDG
ncbi:MAG: S-methyl-5-thioribose-1-phosphate isomerase [Alphaproteobacteria bacterium]